MNEIDTEAVYKQLKKQNGERVARVIRENVLLDIPNIVHILEFAGNNPDEARELVPVIREIYKRQQETSVHSDKNPLELLSEAGYDAFVVTNEQEKNSIKKYYRPDEELCTFRDPYRHRDYYIIHAVKRDADKIKPSQSPQREDEYGTSVISIQIAKSGGFISIKNRYNHTVPDPDNTFNSNPDNIIPGLSESLKTFFHVEYNAINATMPHHFTMVHNQLVRYDYEINNIYFGHNYYFSGSNITKLNNTNQILFFRGFILTLASGNSHIDSIGGDQMSFCKELNEIIRGKKITVGVAPDKTRQIFLDGERFLDIKDGEITFINAPNIDTIYFNSGSNLHGDIDFSGVRRLWLQDARLANVTSMKLNPHAEDIELSNDIELSGDLDFSGVDKLILETSHLDKVTSVKFNPNAHTIIIRDGHKLKLHGNIDFSNVQLLALRNVDLSHVSSIKLNSNAWRIDLCDVLKASGGLDFSSVQDLTLQNIDQSEIKSIKFNPHAEKIHLGPGLKLSGDLDFSDVYILVLKGVDLTEVTSMQFNQDTRETICIENCTLAGNWDFSNLRAHYISLKGSDLSAVTHMEMGDNYINFDGGAIMTGVWDFTNREALDLCGADFTRGIRMKLDPDREVLSLKGTKFAGVVDLAAIGLGNIINLHMEMADLTRVTEFKCNIHANLVWMEGAQLGGDLDFSTVDFVRLNDADFTHVKSIKLSPKLYKRIKDVTVQTSHHPVLFKNLEKYGVKIIKNNIFTRAREKILAKIANNMQSEPKPSVQER